MSDRVLCPIARQSPMEPEQCAANQAAFVACRLGSAGHCRGPVCRLFVGQAMELNTLADMVREKSASERERIRVLNGKANRNWVGKTDEAPRAPRATAPVAGEGGSVGVSVYPGVSCASPGANERVSLVSTTVGGEG